MRDEARLERLKSFLEQDPENWNLRADIFDAALDAGERDLAREQVQRALAGQPGDQAWRHREGLLLLAGGLHAEAQAVFEALLADGLDQPVIRFNLAYALFCQGRFDAVLEAVASARSAPDETGAMAWALWLRAQHRRDRFREAYREFVGAPSHLPHSPETWGVASFVAFDAGGAEARAWAERALAVRSDQLEALATMGSLALKEQDGAGARTWFERAVRARPDDGRAWSGLAFANMLQRAFPEAIAAFEKAVVGMPDHVGTWLGLGWCQVFVKQPAAARATFERALALDRNVAESHGALAVALGRLGQTDAATREIEVALRLDPKALSARYAQAILKGTADDPEEMLWLSRRLLSRVPASAIGRPDKTLEEVVFDDPKR